MELDHRFRPGNGKGSRIILLGDGTEISTEAPDSEMFDQDDEDKDLDSQVDKYHTEESSKTTTTESPETTQSPSSITTEQSDATPNKDTRLPDKAVADEK
jgi:protein phosphatase 2C family protein 2/3